jgi:voltage-gated potassium channel
MKPSQTPASLKATHPTAQPTAWDLLLACLSVYVITAIAIELVFELPEEVSVILHIMDVALCVIFLIDFAIRFLRAPDKRQFMKWGWIDLLASIPSIETLRWGRAVSLARVFLVLRAFRSARMLWRVARVDPGKFLLTLTLLGTTLTMVLSSICILWVETAERSNIKTGADALWWSLTTITTVGYGDHFPVTVHGRIIAAVLMALGISLYATCTAFISSKIMELSAKPAVKTSEPNPPTQEVLHELQQLRKELAELRAQLALEKKP